MVHLKFIAIYFGAKFFTKMVPYSEFMINLVSFTFYPLFVTSDYVLKSY